MKPERRVFVFRSYLAITLAVALVVAPAASARGDGPVTSPANYAADLDAKELNSYSSELRGMMERFAADRANLLRFHSIPFSPRRIEQLRRFYSDWLAMLGRVDFDALSQPGQVDAVLFRNALEHALHQLDFDAKEFAEILPLLPFAETIISLEENRRHMAPLDSKQAAAALSAMPAKMAEIRRGLEAGLRAEGRAEPRPEPAEAAPQRPQAPPPSPEPRAEERPGARVAPIHAKKAIANRASNTVTALRNFLKSWYDFYNGYDPVFTWWVAEPYKSADQALQQYGTFLRERVVGVKADDRTAIIGDPIGREALLQEIAAAMIPYSPEEMIAIAQKELAWDEEELKKAARELGYGDDWHKALEHVKQLHVEPGQQPELIRKLALEAIEYMDRHELVTIPPLARDSWRMEMLSPERQLMSPFFLGGEVIQVSFPTNTMTHEQKMMSMRGNNMHFARATVFHEVIPGHGLQGFMAGRYRPYRQAFGTPFWTEGNAFYWEMLLWDLGFPQTPENRLGMLFWRTHRAARVIFSLSFHLGKMTPEECVNFLVERVGHERENAAAEVRRSFDGSYGPLYQCAYMFGALQFYALHKELVETGKMTNRQFHDAILKENRMPVELVRAALTGQKLTRDYKSSWRFYGSIPAGK